MNVSSKFRESKHIYLYKTILFKEGAVNEV